MYIWLGTAYAKTTATGGRCRFATTERNNHDGRDQESHALRRRRIRRRGHQDLPKQGHGEEAPGDYPRRQAARSVDRERGRARHPPLGDGPRRHPLHPLVPADDRLHRREARLVPGAEGRRADHAVQREEPHRGRAGRLVVPLRRAASAPPSRRAATRRGIRRAPPSSSATRTARRSASRPRSAPTPASRSTRRRRSSGRCRRSTSRSSA